MSIVPHDPVKTPAHYHGGRGLEVIAVIEDWGLGFHLGNAVKYVLRAGQKGPRDQDLEKACRYLSRAASIPEIAIFPTTFAEAPALEACEVANAFGLGWNCTCAITKIAKAVRCETGAKAASFLRDAKTALERELGYAVDDWSARQQQEALSQ